MSKKQLGAAPEVETEVEPVPGERLSWFARLRAQPGFRTAAVAFVLTVALGVGGPAAYAYWSQSTSGTITGTTRQPVPVPAVPTPTPTPSTSKPAAPAPTPTPSTSKPAAPAPTPTPSTSKPAAPAPAPSPSPSVAPVPTRPALPALTGKAVCGPDPTGKVAVSRPTPAGSLPPGAVVVMTIVDPKGTTVYVVNQTTPVALKNVPGLESRLKGVTGTTRMTISFTTGYVTDPLITAPIGLIDATRVLEWSKSPAVSTGAAYDALLAKFSC